MAYDEKLAGRIRSVLQFDSGFVEKKMFGGLGFMVSGNLCCCVAGDDLMARVGVAEYEAALAMPHAREMDLTGRPMRGWVLVSSEGVCDDDDLEDWLVRSLRFVKTLPEK